MPDKIPQRPLSILLAEALLHWLLGLFFYWLLYGALSSGALGPP